MDDPIKAAIIQYRATRNTNTALLHADRDKVNDDALYTLLMAVKQSTLDEFKKVK